MPRNGLSRKKVIESAAKLIERFGVAEFSMRALADSLNVKTASLYNHIESMESLMVEVCVYALEMQRNVEMTAIKDKSGDDAIFALADAYRKFAKEHCELYRMVINTAVSCTSELNEISQCIVVPFLTALDNTTLTDEEKIHWQRVLRGIVHGFVSQEEAGFFSHLPADVDDSFRIAIECYASGLKEAERRNVL